MTGASLPEARARPVALQLARGVPAQEACCPPNPGWALVLGPTRRPRGRNENKVFALPSMAD